VKLKFGLLNIYEKAIHKTFVEYLHLKKEKAGKLKEDRQWVH
jgi:hypothetical protein